MSSRLGRVRYRPSHLELTGHTGGVNSVAAGELEGRPVLISGSSDYTIRVWG